MTLLDEQTDQLLVAQQRLIILQRLADSPNYTTNEFLLQAELVNHGLSTSLSQVKSLLTGLELNGFVRLSPLTCTLTHAGLDVAKGYVGAQGIAKPLPKQ